MTDDQPTMEAEVDGGLRGRVLSLSSRAERALSGHARTQGLLANLPRADEGPLRIALLGPYSAGKSMLIAALLRLPPDAVEELTDAAPKTTRPRLHAWNGATLVDLPGTLSGIDEHADVARQGVRNADVIMIVTTSELPGEAETEAIQQALGADGFADRCVVVVNKMNAENSDPEVIFEEIRKRLGHLADRVPILRTDAKDYVDALNDPDLNDSQREMLVSESGIDALSDELHRIIEPGVDRIRPSAQAFELARVLADAEERWVLDGEELTAAEVATKVEDAVSQAEEAVVDTLESESEAVASVIRAAGSRIATSVSEKDGKLPEDVVREADQERADALATFEAALVASMKAAFDRLDGACGTDVPEPGPWRLELGSPVESVAVAPDEPSPIERNAIEAAKAAMKDGAERLRDAIGKVAINGERGGLADKVAVRLHNNRVGHRLLGGDKVGVEAGKFKPWGRGKAADKVAGAAGKIQWAAVVIGPALDLKGLADDYRKRAKVDKYRAKLNEQFDSDAVRTRDQLVEAGTQWLTGWVADVECALSSLTARGAEIAAEQERALGEIRNLSEGAAELVRVARRP